MKRKILLVIDMQNDFITGSLANEEGQKIVGKVTEKILSYKAAGDEILYTQDTHFENYMDTAEGRMLPVPHCIQGTKGWELIPEISEELKGCRGIQKKSFGYTDWEKHFTAEEVKDLKEGNAELEMIGVCTDICVVSNAMVLKALYPESTITADFKCCAATTLEKQEATAAVLESCQVIVNR